MIIRRSVIISLVICLPVSGGPQGRGFPANPILAQTATPITATTTATTKRAPSLSVCVREITDYVFGGYRGEFRSPPSADGNPRRAIVITWKDFPSQRLVFCHEG